MTSYTTPKQKMAKRLFEEFRPTTDMGDEVILHGYEADRLADIIAEYVDAAIAATRSPLIASVKTEDIQDLTVSPGGSLIVQNCTFRSDGEAPCITVKAAN